MEPDRRPSPAGQYFGVMHRFARKYFGAQMDRLGLPRVAFPFILGLLHRDGVSQDDLASGAGVDKATVTRHITELEEAGLVTRTVDEEDRRIKRVRVTDKARELAPAIHSAVRAWHDKLLSGFTSEERYAVLEFLRRMAENAREHWEEVGQAPSGNLQQQNGTRGVDF